MAALTDPQRAALHADLMRTFPGSTSVLKAELRAVVDAIDDWVVANASAFNTAIPTPQRTALTATQKAWLLAQIVTARYVQGA